MDGGFLASPLVLAAVSLHECYLELRSAGFTQDEALSLLAKMGKENTP